MGNVFNSGMIKGKLNVGQGKDGISAYEVALNNGFEGTEQEWLESIKGEKGDTGNSGVYLGSGEMPEDCNVQIDPNGDVVDFGGQIVTVEQINALDAEIKNISATVEQKNDKTHWIEKVPVEEVFFEEATITPTLVASKGLYRYAINDTSSSVKWKPNIYASYEVVYNGVAYNCKLDLDGYRLGNLSLLYEDKENTGEPFLIVLSALSGGKFTVWIVEEGTHTISVTETTYEDVYHKIDINFLPLEEITLALTTDDGTVKHYVLYGREVVE